MYSTANLQLNETPILAFGIEQIIRLKKICKKKMGKLFKLSIFCSHSFISAHPVRAFWDVGTARSTVPCTRVTVFSFPKLSTGERLVTRRRNGVTNNQLPGFFGLKSITRFKTS
jgi:hypothetical protein